MFFRSLLDRYFVRLAIRQGEDPTVWLIPFLHRLAIECKS